MIGRPCHSPVGLGAAVCHNLRQAVFLHALFRTTNFLMEMYTMMKGQTMSENTH